MPGFKTIGFLWWAIYLFKILDYLSLLDNMSYSFYRRAPNLSWDNGGSDGTDNIAKHEHLLCARHLKYFTDINSFHLHNVDVIIIPLDWSSDFCVKKLVSIRIKIQPRQSGSRVWILNHYAAWSPYCISS